MTTTHKSESPAATGLNADNQNTHRKFSAKSTATEAQYHRIVKMLGIPDERDRSFRWIVTGDSDLW